MTPLDDIGLARDDFERLAGDLHLLAERTHRREAAGGLRGHQHLHAVTRRGHRVRAGGRPFDGAVHAAEQIDFVGRLDHILEQPQGLRRMSAEFQDLIRGRIAPVHSGGGDGRCRIAIGACARQHRPCRGEVGVSRNQRTVRLQRLADQRVEPRILV